MKSIVQEGDRIDVLLDLLDVSDEYTKQKLYEYAKLHDERTYQAAVWTILIVVAIFMAIKPAEPATAFAATTLMLTMIVNRWTGGRKHKRLVKSNNVVK